MFLKQSTAVTVKIGPFVDDADGNTAETALTIAQADVRLSKNGGSMAQKGDATGCTHDELGYYTCPLSTTDTGTLGILYIMVHESGALPVHHRFVVLAANVYDSLIGGGDVLDVNTTQIEGADPTDTIRDSVVDDATEIDASALNALSALAPGSTIAAASDIPAAGDNADAVWDEALSGHAGAGSAGEALDAAGSGADAATIADAVWDEDITEHTDADSAGEALGAAGSGADAATIADAVLDEALSGHTTAGTLGKAIADTETDAGTAAAGVAAIETDTQDIQSRLPAALVGGAMDADVSAIQTGAITADSIATGALTAEKAATGFFDAVLQRAASAVESGADKVSLLGVVLAVLGKRTITDTTHSIYETDDATVFATQDFTVTEGADPITAQDQASAP